MPRFDMVPWCAAMLWIATGCAQKAEQSTEAIGRDGIVKEEFIFDKAPFASCHASTIAQTKSGLVAAWFGGTSEGKTDVGIWVSRHDGQSWSEPVEVATGQAENGKRYPCWNPVLYAPKDGPLVLFYKVGPRPSSWWGMRMTSHDAGRTWSAARRLGDGILGPIKNKPVLLADGALLCPSSTEHAGWRVHLEVTRDLGDTCVNRVPAGAQEFDAIQPAVLAWGGQTLQILCRSKQKTIVESWSDDGGKTWGPLKRTQLPNPNSGIDAVTLRNGIGLLLYNNTTTDRTPLNVAVSADGKQWTNGPVLETEPGEYSYPAVIQTDDGRVHITYTWKRQRIKHVVIDPAKLPKTER